MCMWQRQPSQRGEGVDRMAGSLTDRHTEKPVNMRKGGRAWLTSRHTESERETNYPTILTVGQAVGSPQHAAALLVKIDSSFLALPTMWQITKIVGRKEAWLISLVVFAEKSGEISACTLQNLKLVGWANKVVIWQDRNPYFYFFTLASQLF